MIFLFQLVDHRHGVILDRDETLSFLVEKHIVFAQTVFPGTHARPHVAEISGGRKEYPVDLLLLHQRIQVKLA